MKKAQNQLKSVAKTLANLAGKLESIGEALSQVSVAKKGVSKKKAATKKKAPARKAAGKKRVAAKKKAPAEKAAAGKDTVLDKVYDVIKKSRNGANIASLKEKTQLESRQLSNALYKLSKKGKIKSKSRGVYIKA